MTEPIKPKKDDENELAKLKQQMVYSKLIVGGIITIVLVLYFSNFHVSVSVDNGDWGTFGDFFGGILNPVIASFALYWLITSVNLQIQELKKTNEALEKTVETAEKQQNQASIQNFESLFFQLLKTKNDALDDIEYKKEQKNEKGETKKITILKSVDAIKQHIIDFKNNSNIDWHNYYEKEMLDYTGSYFRICYQIVKLINRSEILKATIPKELDSKVIYSIEQKKYFDIFRATLTKHEIEAFFFNCLSEHGNKKFKLYIEKYGLFEPLPIDLYRPKEKIHRLTKYAYQYNSIVFESNKDWKQYYIEIKNIKLNINTPDLVNAFKILLDLEIIKYSLLYSTLRKSVSNPSISGTSYQFNNIKFNNIDEILSEKNFSEIENRYQSHYEKITNAIEKETINIKNYNELIKHIETIFKNENRELDINEVVTTDKQWDIKHSVSELQKNKLESEIAKKSNEDLLIKYNSDKKIVKNNEYILTTLTLIKYGIDYTEYNKYINLHSTIDGVQINIPE